MPELENKSAEQLTKQDKVLLQLMEIAKQGPQPPPSFLVENKEGSQEGHKAGSQE